MRNAHTEAADERRVSYWTTSAGLTVSPSGDIHILGPAPSRRGEPLGWLPGLVTYGTHPVKAKLNTVLHLSCARSWSRVRKIEEAPS
jgi:hypothetical protein